LFNSYYLAPFLTPTIEVTSVFPSPYPKESENIILLVDVSGSMGYSETQGLALSRTLCHSIVDNISSDDQIAIIEFTDNATVKLQLTNDSVLLNREIENIGLHSGGAHTQFAPALQVAQDLLIKSNPSSRKVVFIFSDGVSNEYEPNLRSTLESLKSNGISIFAVQVNYGNYDMLNFLSNNYVQVLYEPDTTELINLVIAELH
jgi:Mg-chelatase subunit ChlD